MAEFEPQQATEYYNNGVYFKSQGQTDKALTEFRRAVIADPNHLASLLEMGAIFKTKSNSDPQFINHAYDAYKKAASLDLHNQLAHDQYITLASKKGDLEPLYDEYKALSEKHPDNELLKRCTKNILSLTMAMIPDNVAIDGGSSQLRKAFLISAIVLFLMGLSLIIGPTVGNRAFKMNLSKEDMQKMAKAGVALLVVSGVSFVARSRF